jgi:hypothetical protein
VDSGRWDGMDKILYYPRLDGLDIPGLLSRTKNVEEDSLLLYATHNGTE